MSRGDAVNQRNRTRVLPKPDCYDYIRRYYGVPAYIGVRVKRRDGREGVLVEAKHSLNYVHILLDDEQRSDVYHPTDGIEYLVVGRAAVGPTDVADARAHSPASVDGGDREKVV